MIFIKKWIIAARPRTLFLSISVIIISFSIAFHDGYFNFSTLLLCLLLSTSVQILSNFANDLGDYQKGTDTTGFREGPKRSLQSGDISHKSMKKGIYLTILFTLVIGTILLFNLKIFQILIFALLGIICIISALLYTMGKYAYGYRAMGDIFAFIFFGPIAVIGSYFLQTKNFNFSPILPSIGVGIISIMILNINNMRDIKNDIVSNKITIAGKLGIRKAKIYHTLLTISMFLCFLIYTILYTNYKWYNFLYVLVFIFQLYILKNIFNKEDKFLDPYLKQTALSAFILSIIFALSINIHI